MTRLVAAAALAAFLISVTGTGESLAVPPGLTPYGRLVWNLDALVYDTFGSRRPCYDGLRSNVFSVPQSRQCPLPLARYSDYTFTFLNAFHSGYRLAGRSNPWAGTNAAPFFIAGRAISCGRGSYIGLFHGGGLWSFGCQRR